MICDNYVRLLILFLWRHAALPVQINTSWLSRTDSNQRESSRSSSCRTGIDPCTQQTVILSFFFLENVGFDTYVLYWTRRCAGRWAVPCPERGKTVAWKMCCCRCFAPQVPTYASVLRPVLQFTPWVSTDNGGLRPRVYTQTQCRRVVAAERNYLLDTHKKGTAATLHPKEQLLLHCIQCSSMVYGNHIGVTMLWGGVQIHWLCIQ